MDSGLTSNKTNLSLTSIGIVVPTSFELKPYFDLWPGLKQIAMSPWEIYHYTEDALTVSIIVSYIGPANAAAATERLIASTPAPQAILHGGAAGAVNADFMPGDIVLGKNIKTVCSREILAVRQSLLLSASAIRYLQNGKPVHVDSLASDSDLFQMAGEASQEYCNNAHFWAGPGWPVNTESQDRGAESTINVAPRRKPQWHSGTLGSQDGWTKNHDELTFLAQSFGVDTEDMESAYVAQIAAKHQIPFLAVRVISNNERLGTLAKEEILPAIGLAARCCAQIIVSVVSKLNRNR